MINGSPDRNGSKVLVVAAHPDDEILGCGGTIARLALEGREVHILICGEGISSRYERREEAPAAELDALRARARQASEIVHAKSVEVLEFPDNRFDTVPLLEIVKAIEARIHQWAPRVLYVQHGGDLNIDHVQLFRAALTATRPTQGNSVKEVYAFEVASSTEWSFQRFSPVFRPSCFVDISTTMDAKIAAMECYESEVQMSPHPRAADSLRAQARRWGSVIGCEYAEPFEQIRAIV
jgi:LmbE family N-acetylglucosaminyl deacetylase